MGVGEDMSADDVLNLPLTPRTERVLAAAVEDARSRGHDYLGTEHLQMALAKERDGIAGQVLEVLGSRRDVVSKLEEIMNSAGYATEAVHPDDAQ